MRTFPLCLIALALLGATATASAATDQTTFNVKLIVTKACTISTTAATDVDFTSLPSTTTGNSDANGNLNVRCSLLTPYTVALSAGANAGTANDVTTRRMKNVDTTVTAGNYVAYQLYSDAAHTSVWGATTGTNTVAGVGTGLNQALPVYGRIANLSANNPAAGSLQDTITATITF